MEGASRSTLATCTGEQTVGIVGAHAIWEAGTHLTGEGMMIYYTEPLGDGANTFAWEEAAHCIRAHTSTRARVHTRLQTCLCKSALAHARMVSAGTVGWAVMLHL